MSPNGSGQGDVVEVEESGVMDGHHRIVVVYEQGGRDTYHVDGPKYENMLVMRDEDRQSRAVRNLRVQESTIISEMVRMRDSMSERVTRSDKMAAWRELSRSLAAVQSALEDRGARTSDMTPETMNGGVG